MVPYLPVTFLNLSTVFCAKHQGAVVKTIVISVLKVDAVKPSSYLTTIKRSFDYKCYCLTGVLPINARVKENPP